MILKNKINIYTEDNHALKKDWLHFLIHPIKSFWGDGTLDWDNHKQDFIFFKSYFTITKDIKKADVAFLPLTLNYYIKNKNLFQAKNFINLVKNYNLKSYIWVDGDNQFRFMNNNEDCVFIKYFGYSSNPHKNELIKPGDLKYDLLKFYFNGQIKIKTKSKIPRVGFDGLANYPKFSLLRLILKNITLKTLFNLYLTRIETDHIFPYLIKRNKILTYLEKSSIIDTNFKKRNIWAEGTVGNNSNSRNEFLNNILSSDYSLCYRGAANYSLRFYETLCLGKIPLLIDTDCKLPFENLVNWKEICLFVKESDLRYIPELIVDFHNSHNKNQFIQKQIYCREIWVKYLSKKGFYKLFFEKLKSNLMEHEA